MPAAWVAAQPQLKEFLARGPLSPDRAAWRVVAIRSVVVGPARFNRGLADHGLKSAVHYAAFERLLHFIWERAGDGAFTRVLGDKHGGRHFYFKPLSQSFPDIWIERRPEATARPEPLHRLRDAVRRLELRLMPRADSRATDWWRLASIVSKTDSRASRMDAFNAFTSSPWVARGFARTAIIIPAIPSGSEPRSKRPLSVSTTRTGGSGGGSSRCGLRGTEPSR